MTTRMVKAASIGNGGSVGTTKSRDRAGLEGGGSTSDEGEDDRDDG